MAKLYLYNENTHTLHIRDCCSNAKPAGLLEFSCEDDALKYAGRSLGICKVCAEKRDQILQEHFAKK